MAEIVSQVSIFLKIIQIQSPLIQPRELQSEKFFCALLRATKSLSLQSLIPLRFKVYDQLTLKKNHSNSILSIF